MPEATSSGPLLDAAVFAIDQGIERIDASLLNIRATRPKSSPSTIKRALVAYRRMRLGNSVALELFPELEQQLQGSGAHGVGLVAHKRGRPVAREL
jgi:hypothetical protein